MSYRDIALALMSWIGINTASALRSWYRVWNENDELVELDIKVSIIIPAWYEPEEILRKSIESVHSQNIVKAYRDRFEIIVVNGELPEWIYQYADKVLYAPRGKLNARHLATQHATGDIIVSIDADTIYPCNFINLLLKPFTEPDVVATTSSTWLGGFEPFINMFKHIHYGTKMLGRGCAYWKWAYYAVGGFNLDINQEDVEELIKEEEINFFKKLSQIGRVVYVDAPAIHLGEVYHNRGIRWRP